MNTKKLLFSGAFLFTLANVCTSVQAYTVTIHNRDWRDHKLKIDVTGGKDKHPVVKAGKTESIGVGGYCTRAVEIESPGSRKGARVENPGGNCDSWEVFITRDSNKNNWLDAR